MTTAPSQKTKETSSGDAPAFAPHVLLPILADLAAKGQLDQVERQCREHLARHPNDLDVLFILANVYNKVGRHNEAIAGYGKILELDPTHWSSLYSLGVIMLEHRMYDQAAEFFKSTLFHKPDFLPANEKLQQLYLANNDTQSLLAHAMMAVKQHPDRMELWLRLSAALMGCDNPFMPDDFIRFVAEYAPLKDRCEGGPPMVATFAMLASNVGLRGMFNAVQLQGDKALVTYARQGDLLTLLQDELFIKIIENNTVCSQKFERFMAAVRYALLVELTLEAPNLTIQPQDLKLMQGIAGYFFRTEYIVRVTEEEKVLLQRLKDRVVGSVTHADASLTVQEEADIILLAMYEALKRMDMDAAWKALQSRYTSDNPLYGVLQLTYADLALEEEVARTRIESFGSIQDDVSLKVREQYEENPYPRWDSIVDVEPIATRTFLRGIVPYPYPFKPSVPDKPSILVAGCGTGRQPLNIASYLPHADIFAIDISRRSLAYALLKSEEMKFKNIQFMHMDILDIPSYGKTFDMVFCSGVLHHMREPMDGWRSINQVLKPGGLMNIALYSKLSRQAISKAREEIAAKGYKDTPEDIRKYREEIIFDPNNPFMTSSDFFTESTLRDLLFHRQEHQFTIPQIKQCLQALNLKFIGFANNSITYQMFDECFPFQKDYTNLDLWDQTEQRSPRMFAAMYQFWCYKPE
jgi:SAM-dependent methyltransferase